MCSGWLLLGNICQRIKNNFDATVEKKVACSILTSPPLLLPILTLNYRDGKLSNMVANIYQSLI